MAVSAPKDSVWSAMAYTPPRGRCNFKSGLMTPACPCLRFMLHPVKAATSFECDGCNHHASFHSMTNPEEEAILSKWAAEDSVNHDQSIRDAGSKKRRLLMPTSARTGFVVHVHDDDDDDDENENSRRHQSVTSGKAAVTASQGRSRASRRQH